MSTHFTLTIEVDIRKATGGDIRQLAPIVNDALQELVNRRDFRAGQYNEERPVNYLLDHGDLMVGITVSTERSDEPTKTAARASFGFDVALQRMREGAYVRRKTWVLPTVINIRDGKLERGGTEFRPSPGEIMATDWTVA